MRQPRGRAAKRIVDGNEGEGGRQSNRVLNDFGVKKTKKNG